MLIATATDETKLLTCTNDHDIVHIRPLLHMDANRKASLMPAHMNGLESLCWKQT